MKEKRPVPGNLYLIGFMGSGKSAAAGFLNRNYNMPLIEMDQEIEKNEGMPPAEIFAEKGEEYFRDLETRLLGRLQKASGIVVSCGGGVPMRPENVEMMKNSGKIVLLTASPETILERVSRNNDRPVLAGRKTISGIRELMEKRRPAYEAAADLVVENDKESLEEVCRRILEVFS